MFLKVQGPHGYITTGLRFPLHSQNCNLALERREQQLQVSTSNECQGVKDRRSTVSTSVEL